MSTEVLGWWAPSPSPALARALVARGVSPVLWRGDDQDAAPRCWAVDPLTRAACLPCGVAWLWTPASPPAREARLEAVRAGAYDVVPLDGAPAEVAATLAARLRERAADGPGGEVDEPPPTEGGFIGQSAAIRGVRAQIARAARTSMPVLITGETGTGKEVAARLVHAWSARRDGRFVPINCAAIPNELMEAQLFGYAKGAFSGAVARFDGWLTAAEHGTVFLDEIDDTPIPTQVKLLRVLEDRVVTRLGETTSHQVDFRILAATNRDLRALIEAGAFGADLFERLAIVSIHLVPLRERVEDIPALVAHFVERFYAQEPDAAARRVARFGDAALELLAAHAWPGNVRELRNVVFATLVDKRRGDEVLVSDLPRRLLVADAPRAPRDDAVWSPAALAAAIDGGRFALAPTLRALERAALEHALARAGGSPTVAARLLGAVGRGRSSDPAGTVRAMMRRLRVTGAGARAATE
jgi:DNA-binding NtrC family response regulator